MVPHLTRAGARGGGRGTLPSRDRRRAGAGLEPDLLQELSWRVSPKSRGSHDDQEQGEGEREAWNRCCQSDANQSQLGRVRLMS